MGVGGQESVSESEREKRGGTTGTTRAEHKSLSRLGIGNNRGQMGERASFAVHVDRVVAKNLNPFQRLQVKMVNHAKKESYLLMKLMIPAMHFHQSLHRSMHLVVCWSSFQYFAFLYFPHSVCSTFVLHFRWDETYHRLILPHF